MSMAEMERRDGAIDRVEGFLDSWKRGKSRDSNDVIYEFVDLSLAGSHTPVRLEARDLALILAAAHGQRGHHGKFVQLGQQAIEGWQKANHLQKAAIDALMDQRQEWLDQRSRIEQAIERHKDCVPMTTRPCTLAEDIKMVIAK